MKKITTFVFAAAFITAAAVKTVNAHCEVPCGIYTDNMRIVMIKEDCKTIAKAMTKIAEGKESQNQAVRWVMNKEKHAEKIQHIVTQYFMTQRIKPTADKYEEKLKLLHGMLISAMKCKQTTDTANVDKLVEQADAFTDLYFSKEDAAHIKSHK